MLNDDELAKALREELHALGKGIQPSPGLMARLNEIPDRRLSRREPVPRWVLAPAGALAAAIIVLLILVVAGSTPPVALAFTTASGKTVRVTLGEIEAVSPANAKLDQLGRVRAVAMSSSCQTPTAGINYAAVEEHPTPRISLGSPPTRFSVTEIVAAEQIGPNRIILAIGSVAGKVPSCVSSEGTGPGLPGFKIDGSGSPGSSAAGAG